MIHNSRARKAITAAPALHGSSPRASEDLPRCATDGVCLDTFRGASYARTNRRCTLAEYQTLQTHYTNALHKKDEISAIGRRGAFVRASPLVRTHRHPSYWRGAAAANKRSRSSRSTMRSPTESIRILVPAYGPPYGAWSPRTGRRTDRRTVPAPLLSPEIHLQ